MYLRQFKLRTLLSGSIASFALLAGAPALGQVVDVVEPEEDPSLAGPNAEEPPEAIVVTGSRIVRAGFDQPTPTTVIGAAEIQQAARVNLQQVLNELPQVRNSVSPNQSLANTTSGTAPVELRALGIARTLTLVNGRRFVGDNNLNFVPTNLVERMDLVTGGASAAWGSGAVAGVVNIVLNDDLEGVRLGAQSGVSTRGDGFRYGFDGAFGTHFADGAGHFMIGAEYMRDKGIPNAGRSERPWFGAGLVNIGTPADPIFELRPEVDDLLVGGSPITFGGTIISGALAGQTFNPDGSLRPATADDAFALYDTLIVGSPLERIGSYARLSYDFGGATVWADAAYGRTDVDQAFLTDPANSILAFSISAANPFLSPEIQQQLAAAGQTSFVMARMSRDAFAMRFDAVRETKEGAIGIEGSFGGGWQYDAHFSHGETTSNQQLHNAAIGSNFARAINAVSSGGQIVCAVNADADPANDDPACVPFNPFGEGAPSAEAIGYTTASQMSNSVSKMDSAAVRLQGDPFSLWAGPVTIALGAEARWEEQSQDVGELDLAGAFATPLFSAPLEGGFNVKEGFVEALVPLAQFDQVEIDLNGAARYSDYSLSGGIWSWKVGGTARLFGDILLRATRSRDIRAPSISNLFAQRSLNIRPVVDNDTDGRAAANPAYNENPTVTVYSGGNADLVPEIGKTWTVGASFSPVSALNFSVDYYDIKISGAIANLGASDITQACAAGDQVSCDLVVRDATGTITTLFTNAQNIARLETSGFDFEASYAVPISTGTLRLRALATYVDKLVTQTGFNRTDRAGSVGDQVEGLPKWRGILSANYDTDTYGLNARVRYVGGGDFNKEQNIVNGDVDARTYVDLGVRFNVMDRLTLFGNMNNVFDVSPPPITTTYNAHYDVIGRYFTVGAKVNF